MPRGLLLRMINWLPVAVGLVRAALVGILSWDGRSACSLFLAFGTLRSLAALVATVAGWSTGRVTRTTWLRGRLCLEKTTLRCTVLGCTILRRSNLTTAYLSMCLLFIIRLRIVVRIILVSS
jgi:hypothetical protein